MVMVHGHLMHAGEMFGDDLLAIGILLSVAVFLVSDKMKEGLHLNYKSLPAKMPPSSPFLLSGENGLGLRHLTDALFAGELFRVGVIAVAEIVAYGRGLANEKLVNNLVLRWETVI